MIMADIYVKLAYNLGPLLQCSLEEKNLTKVKSFLLIKIIQKLNYLNKNHLISFYNCSSFNGIIIKEILLELR